MRDWKIGQANPHPQPHKNKLTNKNYYYNYTSTKISSSRQSLNKDSIYSKLSSCQTSFFSPPFSLLVYLPLLLPSVFMSEEHREFYYHQPFHDDQRRNTSGATTFPYSGSHSSAYTHNNASTFSADSSLHAHLQMFDPSYLSFTEFLHGSADHNSLSTAYGLSPKSSVVKEEEKPVVEAVGGGETPATPNSSISSSSTEAPAGEEDSNKGKKDSQVKETATEDGDQDTSKKE